MKVKMFLQLLFLSLLGSAVAAPPLKGIVLIPDEKELIAMGEPGVFIDRISPPGRPEELEASLTPLLADHEIESETIQAVKDEIYAYYRKAGEPLVAVTVPPQNITDGVLQVVVARSKLNQVFYKGDQPTPPLSFSNLLSFMPGEPIELSHLQENLNFANRNPFRRTEAIFSPGSEPRTTDLTLVVHEEKPFKVFSGTNNRGVKPTGRGRLFSGASFKWDRFDLVGSFEYNSSYDFHRYQSWKGSLSAFLPTKHILNLQGSFALLHPTTLNQILKNRGMSDQLIARYTIPSLSSETDTQDLSFGFDFKQMNNVLEFEVNPPVAAQIQLSAISQLVAEYSIKRGWEGAQLQIDLGTFVGPGEIFPHQSNEDFEKLNPKAQNRYAYGHATLKYRHSFPYGSLQLTSQGQIATGALLPSEQVSIGGAESVRGYEEGEYTADETILSSFEWHFPSFPLLSLFNRRHFTDQCTLLLFTDGAYGWEYGAAKNLYVGMGPGLRYSLSQYLSLSLDLGYKLRREASQEPYKWHFNLAASY